ncbi:hypothetical protein BDV35DRAFT_311912 [Aspergillus flavus]|uniref:Uncharacterized protein n=1 Tax=Aspergillus flavus TaxID=5059 RepID=A0A5N6GRF9_ASPFL|nr:hypothetical protein BDV35DRAFT_311912 [Aspergillus flavus]
MLLASGQRQPRRRTRLHFIAPVFLALLAYLTRECMSPKLRSGPTALTRSLRFQLGLFLSAKPFPRTKLTHGVAKMQNWGKIRHDSLTLGLDRSCVLPVVSPLI